MEVLDDKLLIIDTLGVGGYGVVYRCWHNSLGKEVAVKVLTSCDSSSVERFKAEAKLLSSLKHPGLVSVLAFGSTASGSPYFVMDKVDGRPLSEILRDGPLSPPRLKNVMLQVLHALEYAHSKGAVHRDIKPSNILIVGQPPHEKGVLIDFGIMKILAEDTKLTKTNAVVGTPSYMSPEQCMGQKVDPRSDIYSLGCTIYQCAVGKLPFEGSGFDVLLSHLHYQPETMPAQLAKFLQKCLDKNPDLRFQTAAEAAAALSAIDLDDTSFDIVDGASSKQRAIKSTARIPNKLTLSLVIVALLVVAAGGLLASKNFNGASHSLGFADADSVNMFKVAVESEDFERADKLKAPWMSLQPSRDELLALFSMAQKLASPSTTNRDPVRAEAIGTLAFNRAKQMIPEGNTDILDYGWLYRQVLIALDSPKVKDFSDEMVRVLAASPNHQAAADRAMWLADRYEESNDIPGAERVLETGCRHAVLAAGLRSSPVDLHGRYMYLLRLRGQDQRVVDLGIEAFELCREARRKNPNLDSWIGEREIIQHLLWLPQCRREIVMSLKDELLGRKFSNEYNRVNARIYAGEICYAVGLKDEAFAHFKAAAAESQRVEARPRPGQFYALHSLLLRGAFKTKAEQDAALNEEEQLSLVKEADLEYYNVSVQDRVNFAVGRKEYAFALSLLNPAIERLWQESEKMSSQSDRWRRDTMRLLVTAAEVAILANRPADVKRYYKRLLGIEKMLSSAKRLEMRPALLAVQAKILVAENSK